MISENLYKKNRDGENPFQTPETELRRINSQSYLNNFGYIADKAIEIGDELLIGYSSGYMAGTIGGLVIGAGLALFSDSTDSKQLMWVLFSIAAGSLLGGTTGAAVNLGRYLRQEYRSNREASY